MRPTVMALIIGALCAGCATYQPVVDLSNQKARLTVYGKLQWAPVFISSEPGALYQVRVKDAEYVGNSKRFVVFNGIDGDRVFLIQDTESRLWIIDGRSSRQVSVEAASSWAKSMPKGGSQRTDAIIGGKEIILPPAGAMLFILSVEDLRCLSFDNLEDAVLSLQGDTDGVVQPKKRLIVRFEKVGRERHDSWPRTVGVQLLSKP